MISTDACDQWTEESTDSSDQWADADNGVAPAQPNALVQPIISANARPTTISWCKALCGKTYTLVYSEDTPTVYTPAFVHFIAQILIHGVRPKIMHSIKTQDCTHVIEFFLFLNLRQPRMYFKPLFEYIIQKECRKYAKGSDTKNVLSRPMQVYTWLQKQPPFSDIGIPSSFQSMLFGCIPLPPFLSKKELQAAIEDVNENWEHPYFGPVAYWNVSKIQDFSYVFFDKKSFNRDISRWDVSQGTDFQSMFKGASAFNQNIESWNVSKATNMFSMFAHAASFDQDLSLWNVERVTDFGYMFFGAGSFNGDLSGWKPSAAYNMSYMFKHAETFNRNISSWNVGKVENFTSMFEGATLFNQPLDWDTRSAKIMAGMFASAATFNQDLASWVVDFVVDFSYMFFDAKAFRKPLSSWKPRSAENMESMFKDTNAFFSVPSWYVR